MSLNASRESGEAAGDVCDVRAPGRYSVMEVGDAPRNLKNTDCIIHERRSERCRASPGQHSLKMEAKGKKQSRGQTNGPFEMLFGRCGKPRPPG